VVAWRLPGFFLSQVLDRGAQAISRKAAPCAPHVLDPGAEAVARGASRCASHVLDCGAQAGAQAVACADVFVTGT
jgi:hypothetical protein